MQQVHTTMQQVTAQVERRLKRRLLTLYLKVLHGPRTGAKTWLLNHVYLNRFSKKLSGQLFFSPLTLAGRVK